MSAFRGLLVAGLSTFPSLEGARRFAMVLSRRECAEPQELVAGYVQQEYDGYEGWCVIAWYRETADRSGRARVNLEHPPRRL